MSWLRSFTVADAGSAAATVVVFPPAGAGCLRLRAGAAALPPGLELRGVQLPGREDRLADPPARGLSEVVACVAAALRDPAPGRPLVLLGVSLGAVVAYEVARALEAVGAAPRSLVVAAARSPEHWAAFPAGDPPPEELTALLHPAVRESGPASYAVTALRADLRLMAGYAVPAEPLADTALLSVSGSRDTVVTAAQMSGWRDRSRRYRGHRELDADHHAFLDPDVLAAALSGVAETAGALEEVRG
ncbi:thioesterase II family protein [Streptomyces fungicidicus]